VLKLYHNPKCSKSRRALELLREQGAAFEIIEYMRTPPTRSELISLLARSAEAPVAFVRTKDARFREAGLSLCGDAGIDEVADLLALHPELLERPLAASGERVVIGRSPERVLELAGGKGR
jgi:arsenate reductase